MPLSIASNDYEYISKPSQNVLIYRNHFITNDFSMRSLPLEKSDTTVVLLLGDSVIHGGNTTDHECLSSTILEKTLSARLKRKVRVLNISAKTWSADNNFAYLKRHGTFKAKMLILVANSEDAFDPMTFNKVVGISPDHPDQQEVLAWQVILKKVRPYVTRFFNNNPEKSSPKIVVNSNNLIRGFANLKQLADRENIPFIIYLHKQRTELENKKLDTGGQVIINFCKKNKIPVIQSNLKLSSYQDVIHLTCEGQYELAKVLLPTIYNQIK